MIRLLAILLTAPVTLPILGFGWSSPSGHSQAKGVRRFRDSGWPWPMAQWTEVNDG